MLELLIIPPYEVSCDWPRAPPTALCFTLLLCIHAPSYMFAWLTCTSLSSSQQHLVIYDSKINAVIMCGTLFLLSQCSVFSTLNGFCHSVDTWLGLSYCVVHIRRGLQGLRAAVCYIWMLSCVWPSSSLYLNSSVFTDGVWHWGPYSWFGGADRSEVKWSETGRRRGQERGKMRIQGKEKEVEKG